MADAIAGVPRTRMRCNVGEGIPSRRKDFHLIAHFSSSNCNDLQNGKKIRYRIKFFFELNVHLK
jgi:hypothetical protein